MRSFAYHRGLLAVLGEQIIVSAASFLVLIAAGRMLTPGEFGVMSISLAAVLFLSGIQRNMVIIPMMLRVQSEADLVVEGRVWLAGAAIIALLLTLVSVGTGLFGGLVGWPKWVQEAIHGTAILVPTSFAYEFMRRCLVISGRLVQMYLASLVFLAFGVTAVYFTAERTGSAIAVVLALSLAHLVGAALCWRPVLLGRGQGPKDYLGILKGSLRGSLTTTASHLAYSTYTIAGPILVGGILGPVTSGVLNATRTLLTPLSTLLTGIDNSERLAGVRAHQEGGYPGLLHATNRFQRVLLVLALPYWAICIIFSPQLLQMLFGEEYAPSFGLVYLWAGMTLLMLVTQPLENALYVLRLERTLLFNRLIAAAAGLTALGGLTFALGAKGAVLGACVGWAIVMILSARAIAKARSKHISTG